MNLKCAISQSSKEKARDLVLILAFLHLYLGTVYFQELWVKWKEKQTTCFGSLK